MSSKLENVWKFRLPFLQWQYLMFLLLTAVSPSLMFSQKNKIQRVFVPAGCTRELQPLDITVNAAFKRELKSCFSSWYAKQVSEGLKNGKDIASVKVNFAISTIKPLHANWLMHVITKIGAQQDTIRNGFEKAGISTVFFNH